MKTIKMMMIMMMIIILIVIIINRAFTLPSQQVGTL